jgi:lipopolysaccharide/colanic/teichoic acid biosynthesis glycosyltransferase
MILMVFSRFTENKPEIYSRVKRVLDIVVSSVVLILLGPVLLITAMAVRLLLGSPVIFRQERPGLGEKPFVLYKYRTMANIRDEQGNQVADSQRMTRFGAFLRCTSLDEFPELFNVLKGDMSLVGPRPLLMRYLPYFRDEERMRFAVRPGISGLAQISGRNDLPWDERIALDVYYARHQSLALDIRILLATCWKILARDGVKVIPDQTLQDLDVERRKHSPPT